jgi:hypothetical protein
MAIKKLADYPKNFKGMSVEEARKYDEGQPPAKPPGNEELCRGKLVIVKPAPKTKK